jgi:hypothetical protein
MGGKLPPYLRIQFPTRPKVPAESYWSVKYALIAIPALVILALLLALGIAFVAAVYPKNLS